MNEIKRLQQLAGILTEIKIVNPINPLKIENQPITINNQEESNVLINQISSKNYITGYPGDYNLINFNKSPFIQNGPFISFNIWREDGDKVYWAMNDDDDDDDLI